MSTEVAVIVGAGPGLSASFARLLAREGFRLALIARDTGKLEGLAAELATRTQVVALAADASDPAQIEAAFARAETDLGPPDLVLFNVSRRLRGPIEDLDPQAVMAAYQAGAFAGFLTAQAASRRMLPRGAGTLLFTGATASVKAMPQSAPFAMAKFALRGLAQGLARELGPRGIHVAHAIIDGGIAAPSRPTDGPPDRWLDPDAIAASYLALHRQHRSAWSAEIDLRPWVETF
ncbi:SDR family NAD(P)-dependent oxidoreductase [Xanthobacter tagetidis]|uniref:SDR family NAD(P)-dependent oxidoreductase n=1 Tax=Xanthobacter tagetidis TaxID=60216 RepID=A0A3L6ZYF0_9HYPH|nr:SDR family NAD(P)-dependent oxidoreductase [Xanthobacter tagetidis]MBB6310191.1 NAD(P)-dependent dehydrogenase (short-subunit alcohol dehydrogenase family) [Xanthobacter tagetidis]RLP72844.1 SDR family NAD(P)-dependent oxidoreductase [Xanthobacter tagetidis]